MIIQTFAVGLYFATVLGLGEGENLYPGSRLSNEEASRVSQIIVVARIVNPGRYAIPIQSGSAYADIKLQPSRFLKGKVEDKELTIDWLGVLVFLDGTKEARPENGKEYLFFIERRRPANNTCVKILQVMPANMNAVEDMLRKEERLSGSGMSIMMATIRSSAVVVGTLLELGETHPGPNSTVVYTASMVRAKRTLMGPAEELLKVDFSVVTSPAEMAEHIPVVGRDYILFVETQRNGSAQGCKLLPATNVELITVQQMIVNKTDSK